MMGFKSHDANGKVTVWDCSGDNLREIVKLRTENPKEYYRKLYGYDVELYDPSADEITA
jgi:hypothetical protein